VLRMLRRLALAACLVGVLVAPVDAQSLGTFSWQLAPYCNVITVTVTQSGSLYTLDGYDNQCGAPVRASVVGTAVPNPNGSITLGFTIVTPPGGAPVHVQTAIDLGSLGGGWSDNEGNTGSFVFTPGGVAAGSPRPPATATVGAADIDPTQVQRRIATACAAGQLMTGVNEDGSVTCEAVASGAGGDITGVTAGTGLSGGGQSGAVTLSVAFTGSGSANTVARADHEHSRGGTANTAIGALTLQNLVNPGSDNTAVGARALAVTTGINNTAVGSRAMEENTSGQNNTAFGTGALRHNVTGHSNVAIGRIAGDKGGTENTAVGDGALFGTLPFGSSRNTAVGFAALKVAASNDNTGVGHEALTALLSGADNAAVGAGALDSLTSGERNVALGANALAASTEGDRNIGIGNNAGSGLLTGDDNVYVAAAAGAAAESATTRIGSTAQTRTFVSGIRGATTGLNNALTVVVDSAGQLGTVSSSRRTKFDIADLDGAVTAALQRLRPVQFRYLQAFADGATPIQYGLVAEEVQDVLPELVATDAAGDPASVKYHVLPALLLAEVQRLERERSELSQAIRDLTDEVAALRARVHASTNRH
jgi:hypothetical protein